MLHNPNPPKNMLPREYHISVNARLVMFLINFNLHKCVLCLYYHQSSKVAKYATKKRSESANFLLI